jgi:hypothetical protein
MREVSVQYESIVIAFLSLLFLVLTTLLGVTVRATVKWTRSQDRIQMLADDMKELIVDKDKVHNEMLAQMREDRSATDRRLRWLEEHLWHGGSTVS